MSKLLYQLLAECPGAFFLRTLPSLPQQLAKLFRDGPCLVSYFSGEGLCFFTDTPVLSIQEAQTSKLRLN